MLLGTAGGTCWELHSCCHLQPHQNRNTQIHSREILLEGSFQQAVGSLGTATLRHELFLNILRQVQLAFHLDTHLEVFWSSISLEKDIKKGWGQLVAANAHFSLVIPLPFPSNDKFLPSCRLSSVPFLVPQVPRAKALFSYRGHNPGELRFNKGDVIVLLRQLDQNWYLGELNGVSGVFPASSVQVIKQLPLPPPLCRALYNFDLRSRDRSENNDCLSFHKVTPPCGGCALRAGPVLFFRLYSAP